MIESLIARVVYQRLSLESLSMLSHMQAGVECLSSCKNTLSQPMSHRSCSAWNALQAPSSQTCMVGTCISCRVKLMINGNRMHILSVTARKNMCIFGRGFCKDSVVGRGRVIHNDVISTNFYHRIIILDFWKFKMGTRDVSMQSISL